MHIFCDIFGIGLTQLSTVSFLGGIFGGFDGQAWLNLVKYTITSTIDNITAIILQWFIAIYCHLLK